MRLTQKLIELELGVLAVVARFLDLTPSSVSRLHEIGLVLGTPVCVLRRAPFAGPLHVSFRGSEFALDAKLAQEIEVVSDV